jgi:predicted metal-dependent hydrolase
VSHFQYEINYRKRAKRLVLRVTSETTVQVTAPKGYPIELIQKFITEKKHWIDQKIEKFGSIEKPEFFCGGKIPYLGAELTLKLEQNNNDVFREGHILKLSAQDITNEEVIKQMVIRWYCNEAHKLCHAYAVHYASRLRVDFIQLKVRNFKSRWGSCSADKKLAFNWQMIFLEPLLFKYIVAHEVCHLLEMNHGALFYQHLRNLGFEKNQIHKKMRDSGTLLHF